MTTDNTGLRSFSILERVCKYIKEYTYIPTCVSPLHSIFIHQVVSCLVVGGLVDGTEFIDHWYQCFVLEPLIYLPQT